MGLLGHGPSPENILRNVLEIPLTDRVTRFYTVEEAHEKEQGVVMSNPEYDMAFSRMTKEGEDQDEFEDVMIGQNNPWIMFAPITLPPSKCFYMEEERFDDGDEDDDDDYFAKEFLEEDVELDMLN